LVSDKGIEAARLRTVAAEAGVSMGAVQHYFTCTAEMLRFALNHGNSLLAARVQKLLGGRQAATPRETLRLCCTLLLPLDADSRAGARLWAAFIAHGCVDDPTSRLASEAYAGLLAFVAKAISPVTPGQADDLADVRLSAVHLVSVIDGLRWPLLFGICAEAEALAVLDAQLAQIFREGAGSPDEADDGANQTA